MSEREIQIRAIGIPAALHLLRSVPEKLVAESIRDALLESTEIGIDLMSAHVTDTVRTEKSTGVLAESIAGTLEQKAFDEQTGVGVHEIRIGSNLPYAQYAAQDIGWTAVNRVVFIDPPGHFRFIGLRPPIPGHPFLERTLNDMLFKVIPHAFRQKWISASDRIQSEVDELQGVE
jgi:hypothetical protein